MESSWECDNGPSGSIKCWETIECLHGGLSCGVQLHGVNWLVS
jgi:hypothetical protein